MLKTRKADPSKPPRVLIYADGGIGKSTFGAMADKPVFISAEGGTDQLRGRDGEPVDEMPDVKSFDGVMNAIFQLTNEPHDFKTLVIDSADWIEGMAHKRIIGTSDKDIIRVNGGYSAGLRESEKLHKQLVESLSTLREKRNMMVIVTAHSDVRDAKDPEMLSDYDTYQIKCDKKVSSIWKEWVDAAIFARFKTHISPGENTTRARAITDGSRVAYTVATPAFYAKNRYNLPEEMIFDLNFYNEFMKYARRGIQAEKAEDVIKEIFSLEKLITDEKTKKALSDAMTKAGREIIKLIPLRNRLIEITNQKGA